MIAYVGGFVLETIELDSPRNLELLCAENTEVSLCLCFSPPLYAYDSELIAKSIRCGGCNDCRQNLSATELLQLVQAVLNNNTLLLPQLQTQLVAQLQQIITAGGLVWLVPRVRPALRVQPGF